MKILLINHYAGSPYHGMEYRPYYLARMWKEMGHEVRIIAASESHLRKKPVNLVTPWRQENIDGIDYLWLRTPGYTGNGLSRVINMLAFVSRLFISSSVVLKDFVPDMVIASSTYPLDIYPAHRIASKTGAHLVFEVHDLWPLSPIELGGISRWHPFMLLLQAAENYCCKYSDKVVSILPHTKSHLINHGMSKTKFAYIPNGIMISDWEECSGLTDDIAKLIERIREKYAFIVGYTGAHGLANALDYLIKSADYLRHENIGIVMVGQGSEKEELKKLARVMKLNNIEFVDAVDKPQIPAILDQFDALFIGWHKQPLYRFGISPNKLFDYMMSGKPIIHAIEAANDLVTTSGCGITCEAENPKSIADAILQLFQMEPMEREAIGGKGRDYVIKNHDYRVLAEKFLDATRDD